MVATVPEDGCSESPPGLPLSQNIKQTNVKERAIYTEKAIGMDEIIGFRTYSISSGVMAAKNQTINGLYSGFNENWFA